MRRSPALVPALALAAAALGGAAFAQQTPPQEPAGGPAAEGAAPAEAAPSAAPAADAAAPAAPAAAPAPEPDAAAAHGGLRMEFSLQMDGHPATGTVSRNADGDTRLDLSMRDPNLKTPIKTSIIVLSGNPDVAFNIVHATREMGQVDLPTEPEDEPADRFLFEELEGEKISDFGTRHVKLTDTKSGDEFELWLASAAGSLRLVDRLIRSVQPYQGSLFVALKAHHIDGFPLRFTYKKRSTETETTGALATAELGPVKDGLFAPPKGYRNIQMTSLNPLQNESGTVGKMKKLFKGFGRKR